MNNCVNVLKQGGFLAINIKNIERYNIANDMNKYLSNISQLKRLEDILIFQPKKFKTNKQEFIYVYVKK